MEPVLQEREDHCGTSITGVLGRWLTDKEVHIMHPFKHDFYGHEMSVLVLGYIRPELDYISKGG